MAGTHQVITGALNKGENIFAVGSIEGINFTACAVGCDVVIVAGDFQRVQVIPGLINNNVQVSCVDCCADTGKIAAAYGPLVRIFEPTGLSTHTSKHKLDYRWFETSRLDQRSPNHSDHNVSHLSWNLEGLRLLVGRGDTLHLYQHRMLCQYYAGDAPSSAPPVRDGLRPQFSLDRDGQPGGKLTGVAMGAPSIEADELGHIQDWVEVWKQQLSHTVRYVRYSPDGTLFATAGKDDRLVRVWYQDLPDAECGPDVTFSFSYLYHPRAVLGFEWRKTGRHMPRHCVPNVLITWCEDNISRVWSETFMCGELLELATGDDSLLYQGAGGARVAMGAAKRRLHYRHYRLRTVRHRIAHRLKHLKILKARHKQTGQLLETAEERRERGDTLPTSVGAMEEGEGSPGVGGGAAGSADIRFHLATSINAETDCYLVPSLASTRAPGSFAVHWLNNKELLFSLGVEKLLADALIVEQMARERDNEPDTPNTSDTTNIFLQPGSAAQNANANGAGASGSRPVRRKRSSRSSSVDSLSTSPRDPTFDSMDSMQSHVSTKDLFDMKLEALMRQWQHSSDILFSIHPIDGSLLIWTLDCLDESSRSPSLSFSSRLPGALPITDAASLCHNVVTFNPHDPVFVDLLQKHSTSPLPRTIHQAKNCTIFLLTNHENGSLNLWHLSMDEKSKFSNILNIAHKSRMCGHKFRINKVVCHPVLPLLLTTSHHEKLPDAPSAESPACKSPDSAHQSPSRKSPANEQTGCASELIMWLVTPVGPLCKSGGISELARINSPIQGAFVDLAWVPTILPSSTLGSTCNSPSSCFVASDGHSLRVYQAVIDARTLLAEINADRLKRATSRQSDSSASTGAGALGDLMPDIDAAGGFGEVDGSNDRDQFHVISSQSSARPGCILQLDELCQGEKDWSQIQFFHVYAENSLLGDDAVNQVESPPILSRQDTMVVDRRRPVNGHALESDAATCKLHISTTKVYTRSLDLPPGIQVCQSVPSAGHLPSATLYPACRAPFLLCTACSDDEVRFWRCAKSSSGVAGGAGAYVWEEWKGVAHSGKGAVELEGNIAALSSASSSRFACAYKPVAGGLTGGKPKPIDVHVAIFECESTGGIDWRREDTLRLRAENTLHMSHDLVDFDFHDTRSPVDDMISGWQKDTEGSRAPTQYLSRIPSIPRLATGTDMRRVVSDHNVRAKSALERVAQANRLVHLDWISMEDGGHVLTVGVGSEIHMYTCVSADAAQQNVAAMKEAETSEAVANTKRSLYRQASSMAPVAQVLEPVRWIKIRTISLYSVDGLAPVPMMLSWVRGGVLVVGMVSEMRVYSQWNTRLPAAAARREPDKPEQGKQQGVATAVPKRLAPPNTVSLHISPSHSMLDVAKNVRTRPPAASNQTNASTGSEEKPVAAAGKESVGCDDVVDIVSEEGLFEAARWVNPMLPQYHPKQLFELMNAGRARRVNAILLHVVRCLRQRNVVSAQPCLPQQGAKAGDGDGDRALDDQLTSGRRKSIAGALAGDDSAAAARDYEQIDSVPPLPLYALLAADDADKTQGGNKAVERGLPADAGYDQLFSNGPADDPLDLDMSDEDSEPGNERTGDAAARRRRTRTSTSSMDGDYDFNTVQVTEFTAKHYRQLSGYLTHLHLPGLSSVDQMHLLAVADTLSHFSAQVVDKLALANADGSIERENSAVKTAGGGYAGSVATGVESVDECGLRYLVAMKQHQYLIRCLPINQRRQLYAHGLDTMHIAWALHSDTESEMLNSVSCVQKGSPQWGELRRMGVGWWLRTPATLRGLSEQLAKTAFQAKNEPLDAALFYLAMRKKNVITHLFKSVRDQRMASFFANDFTQEKWRVAALKNAFVLMSKQRFEHAAAFFLLGDSLKDAMQTCLVNLNDIQLAVVILRLYKSDAPSGTLQKDLNELLCQRVLGCDLCELSDLYAPGCGTLPPNADADPFLRSIVFWIMGEYAHAAATLSDEPSPSSPTCDTAPAESNLARVFYFYSYLRTHPLVVRQRLAAEGIQAVGTDSYLHAARTIAKRITLAERRLYFQTATTHLKNGCALLCLDVMSRLPKGLCIGAPVRSSTMHSSTAASSAHLASQRPSIKIQDEVHGGAGVNGGAQFGLAEKSSSDAFDWSTPLTNGHVKPDRTVGDLELKWSDSEQSDNSNIDSDEDQGLIIKSKGNQPNKAVVNGLHTPPHSGEIKQNTDVSKASDKDENLPVDLLAQQIKFVACLKIMMEELATLASGAEVESGKLRTQLYQWLEREVDVLRTVCDYNLQPLNPRAGVPNGPSSAQRAQMQNPDQGGRQRGGSILDPADDPFEGVDDDFEMGDGCLTGTAVGSTTVGHVSLLHEALVSDRADLTARLVLQRRRRAWLWRNEPLLRTLTSYCGLHYSSHGVGLASARMELLLLLLELHQDQAQAQGTGRTLLAPLPMQSSFALLGASIASHRTAISDPIKYLQSQANDLLTAMADFTDVPDMRASLSKVYLLYNLGQCLSACVYESLADVTPTQGLVHLTARQRLLSNAGEGVGSDEVTTLPSKWPGVDTLIAVMCRERDEDSPNLLHLLVRCFTAVYLSLFFYAFTAYDSRWLYRLVAHSTNMDMFAAVFGGGGQVRLRAATAGSTGAFYFFDHFGGAAAQRETSPANRGPKQSVAADPQAVRARYNARLLHAGNRGAAPSGSSVSSAGGVGQSAQTVLRWVPPKRSILMYFRDKPGVDAEHELGVDYDSDASIDSDADAYSDSDTDSIVDPADVFADKRSDSKANKADREKLIKEHMNAKGYAWKLLRLALAKTVQFKLIQFVNMCGLQETDIAQSLPLVHCAFRTLESWTVALQYDLDTHQDGCPVGFMPHLIGTAAPVDGTGADGVLSAPSLLKYRCMLEPHNTPFDLHDKTALPVHRLWAYLIRQEHLMDTFVRYIFRSAAASAQAGTDNKELTDGLHVPNVTIQSEIIDTSLRQWGGATCGALGNLPEPLKIVQRENDPIAAFAVCSSKPGWVVVSTGREMQEMDLSSISEASATPWMHDQAELDVELAKHPKDSMMRNNDDYLLFDASDRKDNAANFVVNVFVVDRSRHALQKLCKRAVNGIRRMEAHPNLPYYLSGASDGSVRLWEWGVGQPPYTPRAAGQFAKVTCVRFSSNGAKFAVSDGDGVLNLWQIGSQGSQAQLKRPFFSCQCHSKSSADVRFVAESSSLVATAGYSAAEHNVAIWDTLLPPNRALVHSFPCHSEGASCVLYVPTQCSLLSGGRSGELCVWDVRQRQLKHTVKAFDDATVRALAVDPMGEFFAAGSADGDIKIWSLSGEPRLLYSLSGEHAGKSTFSLRQGAHSAGGVQQLYVDGARRLYSCGGDCSFKIRSLPSVLDGL